MSFSLIRRVIIVIIKSMSVKNSAESHRLWHAMTIQFWLCCKYFKSNRTSSQPSSATPMSSNSGTNGATANAAAASGTSSVMIHCVQISIHFILRVCFCLGVYICVCVCVLRNSSRLGKFLFKRAQQKSEKRMPFIGSTLFARTVVSSEKLHRIQFSLIVCA